jgi:hypothetical protein
MNLYSYGDPTNGPYDVFLCHNSWDKPEVKLIAHSLKNRGYNACLDLLELPPGQLWMAAIQKQIAACRSAAICFSNHGLGPIQQQELDIFLRESERRPFPIIPIVLSQTSDYPRIPKALLDALPASLLNRTWVDFRLKEPDPLDRLIWGIEGRKTARGVNEEELMGHLVELGNISARPDYEGLEDVLAKLKQGMDTRQKLSGPNRG